MKKALTLALVVSMLFVLSSASFALLGFGGKTKVATGETKVTKAKPLTPEQKAKIQEKIKQEMAKRGIKGKQTTKVTTKAIKAKKVTTVKQTVKPAVPPKK